MRQYLDLLRDIRDNGEEKGDRTGTGTRSVFGRQVRYDLSEGFPAVTTKKLYFNSVAHELLWFLKGTGNIEYLAQNNVHIWDEWPFKAYLEKNDLPIPEVNSPEWREQMKEFIDRVATDHEFALKWGDLGPVYGAQWRHWRSYRGGYDQVAGVISEARHNPGSRRLIVEAWNVGELEDMALPPCHKSHQLSCTTPGYVDMLVYQRSWDLGLGCPFNIAQYALLLHLYARAIGGRTPRYLRFVVGDGHIYWNHIDKLTEVAQRQVVADEARLVIDTDNTDIDGYDISHFSVVGYGPQPAVKLEVAV